MAAEVSLLLAVGLGVAVAAILGTTVLRTQGLVAVLAGAAGVAASGVTGPRTRRGVAAATAVLVAGLAAALLLRTLPGAAGASPLAGLGPILGGSRPGRAHTLGLELLLLLLGVWIGWWSVREGRALVAAGAAAVVGVADLVNVPGGHVRPASAAVIAAVAAAVVLVGWVHQERVRRGWRDRRVPVLPGTRGRSWAAVAAGALALTAISAALPPLNLVNFSGRFFHYGVPGGSRRSLRTGGDVVGYSESVIPGGPLRSVQTPVLTYRSSDPGSTAYLRGVVLETFVAGNWFPDAGVVRRAGPSPRSRTLAARLARAGVPLLARRTVRLTVRILASGEGQVPDVVYPGSPADLPRSSAPLLVRDRRAGGRLVSITSVQPQGSLAQVGQGGLTTTLGTVSTATAHQLRLAGTAYPAWVRSDARLPAAGAADAAASAALRRIARSMIGAARDPYDQALAIQDALRADEVYTLDPPQPPAGTWPILYFLETSHLGYCQYFASSMGALLRAIGIPARLVNGFGPGELAVTVAGAHLVTAADAHTWVQVYFPRYGWIRFEPTPDGFYLGRDELPGASTGARTLHPHRVAPRVGPAPSAPAIRPSPLIRQGPAPEIGPIVLRAAATTLAVALLVAAVAALLLRRMVSSPEGARRRLGLVGGVGRGEWDRARTMSELAALCLAAGSPVAPGAQAALRRVAGLADRAAFATGAQRVVTAAEWREAWAPVRAAYLGLLWRAWRRRLAMGWRAAPGAPPHGAPPHRAIPRIR